VLGIIRQRTDSQGLPYRGEEPRLLSDYKPARL
jgi:hypothetical protein